VDKQLAINLGGNLLSLRCTYHHVDSPLRLKSVGKGGSLKSEKSDHRRYECIA